MRKDLECVAQVVLSKLKEVKGKYPGFDPCVYVGKTDSFQKAYGRHSNEGFPVLLRVAEGTPSDVSELEGILNSMLKQDPTWKVGNGGSAGKPMADKIYICLDSSVEGDPLCEYEEEFFLGKGYPVNLSGGNK